VISGMPAASTTIGAPGRGIGPNLISPISNELRNTLSLKNSRDCPDTTSLQQLLDALDNLGGAMKLRLHELDDEQ